MNLQDPYNMNKKDALLSSLLVYFNNKSCVMLNACWQRNALHTPTAVYTELNLLMMSSKPARNM